MLKSAAVFAASIMIFGNVACCAQTTGDPLHGKVKKTDQLPTRVARPGLPVLNGNASPSSLQGSVDTSSFDLKQPEAAKSAPNADWSGLFDQRTKPIAAPAVRKIEEKPRVEAPESADMAPALRASVDKNGEAQDPWAAELEIIGNYNVMVVLDRSHSMSTADCDGLSRWEWCEHETRNFATITSPIMKDGIDLTMFSESFSNLGTVPASQLHSAFSNNEPYRDTNLADPLRNCMQRARFSLPKKAIVVVITDGEPQDRAAVQAALIQTTKDYPKGYVKVVFLKVGYGAEGDDYIRYLDHQLPARGAAYDLVDSRSFDYLCKRGLLRTLCDVVSP